jgi:hypothetical protein
MGPSLASYPCCFGLSAKRIAKDPKQRGYEATPSPLLFSSVDCQGPLNLSLYVLSVSLVLRSSTHDSNLRLNPVFVVNYVCIAIENAETTGRHPGVSVERPKTVPEFRSAHKPTNSQVGDSSCSRPINEPCFPGYNPSNKSFKYILRVSILY